MIRERRARAPRSVPTRPGKLQHVYEARAVPENQGFWEVGAFVCHGQASASELDRAGAAGFVATNGGGPMWACSGVRVCSEPGGSGRKLPSPAPTPETSFTRSRVGWVTCCTSPVGKPTKELQQVTHQTRPTLDRLMMGNLSPSARRDKKCRQTSYPSYGALPNRKTTVKLGCTRLAVPPIFLDLCQTHIAKSADSGRNQHNPEVSTCRP